tara:strand:+ start:263 stop:784 length:522 start_codon:yes stop_codon:yes gene_type:complete
MYFKKLDSIKNIPSYEIGAREVEYGFSRDNIFKGLWYSGITLKEKLDIIPKKYASEFFTIFLEANTYIIPHTDSNTKAVINFYIETSNCLTQFYEIKENAKPSQINNQTDGYIYNLKDLIKKESFIAQSGDIYILDVSKVHSVIPLDDKEIHRKAICFATDSLNFDEVVEIFT